MSSYMGIGQWAATFSGDVPEGQVAKISGSGAVSACAAGEAFCGVVISAARDGAACSVALGGMLTAAAALRRRSESRSPACGLWRWKWILPGNV